MPSESDPKYPRIPIVLACSVCSTRNYKTTKSTRPGGSALKLKKFCKVCNSHTVHIEGK
ncbi:MAG TPA: 50S ribosomal protein L33 [Polyangiaceae bacterium]